MNGGLIYVTERTLVTLAFMATAVILLLNQALLGPYGQLVVGGLMTAFGTIITSWFVGHTGQVQASATAAAPIQPAAPAATAAAPTAAEPTPGSMVAEKAKSA